MKKLLSISMNILSILSLVFIVIGVASSLYAALILKDVNFLSYIFTVWFWLATVFFGIQSFSFLLSFRRGEYHYNNTIDSMYDKLLVKKVAILVPIYNEEPRMVKTNLMAIYSNIGNIAEVYVLDDSTKVDSSYIVDMCNKLGIKYIHRANRRGYKAGALNEVLKTLNTDYVSVIDIDQMPSPDFIRETVSLLDKYPDMGFIQVPQVYANTSSNILAEMSQAQLFIFYEILTEGKSVNGTLFSCGTNVIYRLSALKSVNFFDETSLVEDIATSLNLIANGWHGLYYNKKLVFGRAPVTMEGYINQQGRWMMGSLTLMPKIFRNIIFNKKYNFNQKLDWFAAATWYLFGWAYLIFLLAPILDILGIKVLSMSPLLYFLAWIPYSIILMSTFLLSHIDKGAPLKFVYFNMCANLLLFPLSISVSINVLRKKRKPFTTARTGGKMPWHKFWPQFLFMFLLLFSSIILIYRYSIYNVITAFWAIFQFSLFLPVFFLNREAKESPMDIPAFKQYRS